jgi:hypothetical protein
MANEDLIYRITRAVYERLGTGARRGCRLRLRHTRSGLNAGRGPRALHRSCFKRHAFDVHQVQWRNVI